MRENSHDFFIISTIFPPFAHQSGMVLATVFHCDITVYTVTPLYTIDGSLLYIVYSVNLSGSLTSITIV